MEPHIAPVTKLSPSSGSEEPAEPNVRERGRGRGRGRSKRKAASQKKKEPDDIVQIQAMLGKKCSCKPCCRDVFRSRDGVQKVLKFRSEWKALHKLDQDEVVPRFELASMLLSRDALLILSFLEPALAASTFLLRGLRN